MGKEALFGSCAKAKIKRDSTSMQNNSANNKRIAKNTLLLYFRMLFMMAVSLYTSRVVLNALGVDDYGIYNVVGGVVAIFSFVSGSLSAAISRFITFDIGTGDEGSLKNTFSAAVTIQLLLSLLLVILIESAGVWFLNEKMNIPQERLSAANWVLQFSIVTMVINLVSVPYNATIIAHERMSAFAYISILEVLGKLAIALLILVSPIDRLVFYAFLMCVVAVVVRFVYGSYCKRHFTECKYMFRFDGELLKRMFGFAGWNFIGVASGVLRDQGGNIVINLFAGPAANAARGIAIQVSGAVMSFVNNFMTALNPQITKSYASGDHRHMMVLIYQGARLSFYMLLLISLPVLANTHYILTLWLKTVPEHTVLFVQLVLVFSMSESISNTLITAMLATGKIRNYQIVVGGLQMMNLPASYVLLRMGCIPETVMVVAICISQCCLALRLYMLRDMIGLKVRTYLRKVYLNVIVVSAVSAVVPVAIAIYADETFLNFAISCIVSVACTLVAIFYIGCNRREREFMTSKAKAVIDKLTKKR